MRKGTNVDKQLRMDNVWTEECEGLLAEWSEKASCYRWLHGRCEKSYKNWYYCFSIPVIILSTLTGAANVGMDSFVPAESKSIASAIVGGVNIFAGIVSTLQNFLKVAELMEGHRIAGVSWGKLQRNIAIELALDPSMRVLQTDFLKLSRSEYDRLIEAGPLIDDGVIKQFNKKFKNYQVSKPSICNGLDKCKIYKIDKTIKMGEDDFKDGIEDLLDKEVNDSDKPALQIKIIDFESDKVNETVDKTVDKTVNETVNESVNESVKVNETVDKTVQVDKTVDIIPNTLDNNKNTQTGEPEPESHPEPESEPESAPESDNEHNSDSEAALFLSQINDNGEK
jgi:hypothetical protein